MTSFGDGKTNSQITLFKIKIAELLEVDINELLRIEKNK